MSLVDVPVTAERRAECTVSDVLTRVGERWSVLILSLVADRPYGFNELDRTVEELSRRILIRTLRSLERDGLVLRSVQSAAGDGATGNGEAVERVEYSATPLGRSLLAVVTTLGQWAVEHQTEIRDAQAAYTGPPVR